MCSSLTVSFLFHFNQDIGPYTLLANRACYRGLVSVLRKHKNKKFNIHISGTLIESLTRFASSTLKELVAGVKEGQFEVLGSTYAQNVMAATDDLSNRYQIEQHLEILQKTFGVRPKGFWIPERCWKQKFVKLLSDFGFTYTLIEKQTLEKLKLKNYYLPYRTSYKNRSLAIVQDDEHFKHKVNFAVWCGENGESFQPALAHLETLALGKDASILLPSIGRGELIPPYHCRRKPSESIVVYAEDAEASGLWGYHFGAYPQPVWKNWDKFLNRLEEDSRYEISTVGEFLKSAKRIEEIGKIPDGQAEWMVQSLRKKGAPYHEDGYSDWFDFNRHSPKIKKYRKFFASLAREIQKAEKAFVHLNSSHPSGHKLKLLLEKAKLLLCRHQYEFGCIGIGKKNYAPFDQARGCLIPLKKFWEVLVLRKLDFWKSIIEAEVNQPNWANLHSPLQIHKRQLATALGKKLMLKRHSISPDSIVRMNQRIFRNQRALAFTDSQWKKYRREVPIKKVWFRKFIADWIFDLAPAKVVQYCKR